MSIAIITDSDSSLSPELALQYDIQLVPITVHFDDKVFTTGVDIDDVRLFEMVDQAKRLPTTAAPPPGAFVRAYQQAFDAGAESIVCICVSSQISATYSAAQSACESFPGKTISVIDSLTLTMGQGFMALAAAEAARSGASHQQVVETALEVGKRSQVFGTLATLRFLAMSGRVGKVAAGMADTLSIKPVLTVRGGKLDMLEKIRTRSKSMQRVVELVKDSVGEKRIQRLALIHVCAAESARELHGMLCAALPCPPEVLVVEFTPGLSVHAGAGLVGAVFVTD